MFDRPTRTAARQRPRALLQDGAGNLALDLVNGTWNGDDRSEIRLVVTNTRHNPS